MHRNRRVFVHMLVSFYLCQMMFLDDNIFMQVNNTFEYRICKSSYGRWITKDCFIYDLDAEIGIYRDCWVRQNLIGCEIVFEQQKEPILAIKTIFYLNLVGLMINYPYLNLEFRK